MGDSYFRPSGTLKPMNRSSWNLTRLITFATANPTPMLLVIGWARELGLYQPIPLTFLHFYSAAALLAMQSAVTATAVPSVRPSVCHTLVLYPDKCSQTNGVRIMRSSVGGRRGTLVFWYQQWLGWGDDVPFHLKFGLNVTQALRKTPTSSNICL